MNKKWTSRATLAIFSVIFVAFVKTTTLGTPLEFNTEYSNQRYRYIPLAKVDEIKDIPVKENDQILQSATGIENDNSLEPLLTQQM